MDALSILFLLATAIGGVALLVALVRPAQRRAGLLAAAAAFAVAGALSITTIGVVFLLLAVGCGLAGWRIDGGEISQRQ